MRLNDLALGLLVLFGGIAVFVSACDFTAIPGQTYGAGTMPRAIALATVVLGLFMTGRSLAAGTWRPGLARAGWTRSPGAIFAVLAVLGAVIFYVVASPVLGFVPTTVAVLFALMLTLRTAPLTALAVSVLACVVIQQAFGRALMVPLPRSDALGFLW